MNIRRSSITAAVVLGLAGVGLTGGVGPIQGAYAAAYPAAATAPAMTQAEKGDPVAVVYYRCELKMGKCTPLDGLYYVHNAVALENLPTATGGAYVSHVAQWPPSQADPTTDELYICDADRATQWAQGTASGRPHCHGDTAKQPWVIAAIEDIHAYPQAGLPPIAWKVTRAGKTVDVHNGAFKCFEKSGSKECDSDFTKIIPPGGKYATFQGGTLEFRHFVNDNPQGPRENGRTAENPSKFQLRPGKVTAPGPDESITIVRRDT